MIRRIRQNGFTLVEIIASMLIVGIMVSVAGFGIVTFMQSYVTTRENVVIAQKANLAMERIVKELEGVTEIDASSGSACIRYRNRSLGDDPRKIRLKDGKIELDTDSTEVCTTEEAGKTLADRVDAASFKIEYLQYDTGTGNMVAWSPSADDLEDLAEIRIEFSLVRNDGLSHNAFGLSINLRGTGAIKAPGVSF